MRSITFAFVREGTSDDGLVDHIRSLLIKAGATSALGSARSYSGTTLEKLRQVAAEDAPVDLTFVHRDADSRTPKQRYEEVAKAAGALSLDREVVAVVPVQELEAWLLVDAAEIRNVVGKSRGRGLLDLPVVRSIETTARPKEALKAACLAASETSGARRQKERTRFSQRRATLLDRLDIEGPVTQLPSWQRFVSDLNAAAANAFARREA